MKQRPIVTIIVLFILLSIVGILIIAYYNGYIFNKNLNNNSPTIQNITITPTVLVSINPNNSLTYPPNDFAVNHINWSSYPNLQTGYVYLVCISEPTDVIPYKFIEVQICTEVKDTENRTIIEEQLGEVAKEARMIYGPSSSINIIGTKGGVARWFASILPYEEVVHF
jgi:hypothetical protein